MFEAFIVWFALVVPWVLGYATGRYWSALLPGAMLGSAGLTLALSEPSDVPDEVDVWPGVLTVLFAISVVICLAGVRMRRKRR